MTRPRTPPRGNGPLLRYRVEELEESLEDLKSKYDKLVMFAVSAVFTFAVAILLLAVNLIVLRKG